VNDGDVRVLKGGRGPCFLNEAALAIRLRDQTRRQDLESHLAVQLLIPGTVYDAHTSSADLIENRIVRNRPAHQANALLLQQPASGNARDMCAQRGSRGPGKAQERLDLCANRCGHVLLREIVVAL
jgi:hypothetical protein